MDAGQAQVVDLGIEGISNATRIGEGGFGVVYRARQEAFGRTVAVKVLRAPALDEDARRRFEQECRAVGSLSGHPHIVAVHASGVAASGQPYLVMEHLPGGTLAQRLSRDGPLVAEEVAEIGVKLAGALAAAHAAGVLHRDIKPENVLLSAYGEPQLVDFGVARVQGGTATRSGLITGSLAHAAPEVLSGHRAEAASDVYSLASTLYALLAGHAPFVRPGEESFHPLLTRVLTEDPPDLRPGVPDALWAALAAALVKGPAGRTADAEAFAHRLRDAQATTGSTPTPFLVPAPASAPSEPSDDPGTVSVYGGWARPASPVAAADAGLPSLAQRLRSRPAMVVGLALALAVVAGVTAALAVSGRSGKSTDVAATATGPSSPETAAVTTTTPTTAPTTTGVATTVPVIPTTPGATLPRPTTPQPAPTSPAPISEGTRPTSPPPAPTTTRLASYVLPAGTTCESQGQLCTPRVGYPATTAGLLNLKYRANKGCSSIKVHVILNGVEYWVSPPVAPEKEVAFAFSPLPPGTYTVELQAEGVLGGCNTGRLFSWGGALTLTTSA